MQPRERRRWATFWTTLREESVPRRGDRLRTKLRKLVDRFLLS